MSNNTNDEDINNIQKEIEANGQVTFLPNGVYLPKQNLSIPIKINMQREIAQIGDRQNITESFTIEIGYEVSMEALSRLVNSLMSNGGSQNAN